MTYRSGMLEWSSGGGGGGSAWWFDPPLASSFTLEAGGPDLLNLTDDPDEGLLIDCSTGNNATRVAYRTLTDKTQDWSMVARLTGFHAGTVAGGLMGLFARDSITGRLVTHYLASNQGWAVDRWNNITSYAGTYINRSAFRLGMAGQPLWFRLRKDGADLRWEVSSSGKQWMQLFSHVDTTWLTNRADQVGLLFARNPSEVLSLQAECGHFSLTGPGV